ncbi:cell division protein ZipA [Modicisalibacter coralii]|uniref:cell division protein ZipA n=1 Tax=Modicisalibacter coralii TaxID=2304602 RepID=UPI00100B563C|nr:cell division protein ZipA [Halomonas coralii]
MELREWLIILGLVLVAIIVVDGVRRLQRQRKVPRLDEVEGKEGDAVDPDEAARQAEINWELPNGGARVVRPASQTTVEPKPNLERQDHPGPSTVFARRNREAPGRAEPAASAEPRVSERRGEAAARPERRSAAAPDDATARSAERQPEPQQPPGMARREQDAPAPGDDLPLRAEREDMAYHEAEEDAAKSRFGSMASALRAGGQRVSQSMQRVSSHFQRHDEVEDAHEPARSMHHHEPTLGDEAPAADEAREARRAPRFDEAPLEPLDATPADASSRRAEDDAHDAPRDDVVTPHPVVEKARRHHVSAQRARETLAHAEEVIVISVLSRDEEGFSGTHLLNLMLACGLRYSEMGIFLRYETEDGDSDLQFAMVDVIKPGTFDLEAMDDYRTPGITFLMPLPGAQDSAAAFEAMFETAMVVVRNLGGELKDENRSVMTAQTVEFARQRVQEFERRHRLHRSQAN